MGLVFFFFDITEVLPFQNKSNSFHKPLGCKGLARKAPSQVMEIIGKTKR
jgi:hypothetical protein